MRKEVMDELNDCLNYLNSSNASYTIMRQKDNFFKSLVVIKDLFEQLEKDEKIEDINVLKPVEDCLNFLNSNQVEFVDNERFKCFCRKYVNLVFNLNMNTFKNPIFERKCSSINRYISNSLTLSETIILLKSVTNNLERWKEYLPPSFRLSEHYLKIIREE